MKRLVTFTLRKAAHDEAWPWFIKAASCPMDHNRSCSVGFRLPVRSDQEPEDGDSVVATCQHAREKTRGADGVYIECVFPGPVVFATSIEAANGEADGSAAQD